MSEKATNLALRVVVQARVKTLEEVCITLGAFAESTKSAEVATMHAVHLTKLEAARAAQATLER